jgi:hypothetical protein
VVYQNGSDVLHVTTASTTITGLTNGQTYGFAVAAHNSAGLGALTSVVSSVPSIVITVPDVPTGLTAVAGNGQVALNWTAPANDGGAAIDHYIIYQDGADVAHSNTNTATISGLTNGRSYSFAVAANNSVGTGAQTTSVSATPIITAPYPPTGLTATPGNAQVSLSWSAPINDGGASIDYYIVYQDGVDIQHVAATSVTITGLTNGQAYVYTVAAHNSVGAGISTSSVSATPNSTPTVPGVPTGLIATPGNTQVSLTWSTPGSNGGAAIDYYLIYVNGTARSDHYLVTSATITDLTNDQQYSFAVSAHNSVGEGPKSSVTTATPTKVAKVPGVPTGLVATPGNTQMTLSWDAPNNDGGAAIDYYIVYQDGIDVYHTTTTSQIITSLTNGQSYSYTVAAHNLVGIGVETSAVTATPVSGGPVPGVPTDFKVTAGNGKVTLSWTAPSGSTSIDYYIVYQDGVDIMHTSATSVTITGLNNGENYSFAVAAHNSGGIGTQTSVQNVTPGVSSSNNNMVYFLGVLALLVAIIIAGFLIVRRNRK